MSTKVNAKFVYSNIEDDLVMVGFANDEFEPTEYLLLQQNITCSEQDKKLGHDKAYITLNSEIHASYGGIKKVVLKDLKINVLVDKQTANKLGSEEQIEIILQKAISKPELLKQHLSLIFKREPGVFVSEI